ncbi:MAG TPA: ATP-binding protein [Candidatus Eisenbacteria bacterium]|nr:ATP-binding protein [Candidatus Eisenbacteria bacterium]
MKSLRSRLILGSAFIALLPLALAIFLLSFRVERMMRTEAGERLDVALGGLQSELEVQAEEVAQKLRILARDVTLKRLYLVGDERQELRRYLEEKRFLLGLDFLAVSDTAGAVVTGSEARSGAAPDSLERGLSMSGAAPILYQGEHAGLLRGGLALDSTFLRRLRQTRGVDLVLREGDRVVASTLGGSPDRPSDVLGVMSRLTVAGQPYLARSFPLDLGSGSSISVIGLVPAAAGDRTIITLQLTAALLGLLGVIIAVVLGVMWSSQVSRPVVTLAAFADRLSRGEWEEPLALKSVGELQTLVAALERMRGDLRRYREQLVIGERHAAWSQMARKVAHEIKNPLTPIAISISDLKRSYEQKRPDFPQVLDQAVRTVGEEVHALKRLLEEFSELGRFPAPVFAPCDVADLFADLEALYSREASEGRLLIDRAQLDGALAADAAQLRQALVNLVKNGLEAIDGDGRVTLAAAARDGGVEITVSDTGPGLSAEQRAHLFVPGFTTKTSGSGLGLTIVERIVHDHGGTVVAEAAGGGGTTFRIFLPRRPGS